MTVKDSQLAAQMAAALLVGDTVGGGATVALSEVAEREAWMAVARQEAGRAERWEA